MGENTASSKLRIEILNGGKYSEFKIENGNIKWGEIQRVQY